MYFKCILLIILFLVNYLVIILTISPIYSSLVENNVVDIGNDTDYSNLLIGTRKYSKEYKGRKLNENVKQSTIRKWEELRNQNHDPNRSYHLRRILSNVSGIYKDRLRIEKYNTSSTVLVNVLSFNKTLANGKYLHLLQNWYCYANHYGLQPITFIVPAYGKSFEDEVLDLQRHGIYGAFITYSLELFWDLLTKKKHEIHKPKIDYSGNLPSFIHFSALVMLVPILEVLQAGYDAIYLDLDIAMIQDPIPYLMKGNAEYTVSLESRSCLGPSLHQVVKNIDWMSLEANTGVMRVRSTKKSIRIYQEWLQRIIDDNAPNDQKKLFFEQFGARISFDCNEHLRNLAPMLYEKYIDTIKKHRIMTPKPIETYPRYCFMNEYLIQNGLVSFHCARDHVGSSAEYLISMAEQNFTLMNKKNLSYEQRSYIPVIVHANFVVDKVMDFERLGLWLPFYTGTGNDNQNQTSDHSTLNSDYNIVIEGNTTGYITILNQNYTICRPYNYSDTTYGQIVDWNERIINATNTIDHLKQKLFQNGTIFYIKGNNDHKEIYMYYEGVLRPIKNTHVLDKLGINHTNMIELNHGYQFISLHPKGEPLKYIHTQHKKDLSKNIT